MFLLSVPFFLGAMLDVERLIRGFFLAEHGVCTERVQVKTSPSKTPQVKTSPSKNAP